VLFFKGKLISFSFDFIRQANGFRTTAGMAIAYKKCLPDF
jgi:hypothetical protein